MTRDLNQLPFDFVMLMVTVVVSGFTSIISMCSCHLLLLHVCGVHNSEFDINIAYSVGVACVSVVAI